jgi:NADH dehydrogenase
VTRPGGVADIIAARLTGRPAKPFKYGYFHECLSRGRRRRLVQFHNADETRRNRVLTGHKAGGVQEPGEVALR